MASHDARPGHLRAVPALRGHRGVRPVVVVCRDDAAAWEDARDAIGRAGAALVLEPCGGPVSEVLGRPGVAVCDRFLEVTLVAEDLTADEAAAEAEFVESRCEECPQAAMEGDGGGWR